MQFSIRKHRQPPAIIIVSLVDILIVMLIFLMMTTTFKHHPSVKITLPESEQAQAGVEGNSIIVTVAKQPPFFYLSGSPLTYDQLRTEILKRANQNPELVLSIRADTDAPFGQVIKVMDIARAAKIKSVTAYTRAPEKPATSR